MSSKGFSTFFISILTLLFFYIPVVQAATHIVTPLAIDLNLNKRDIVNQTITVTNTTNRRLRLYASVHTVATDGHGVVESFVQPVEADRTSTPTAWIEITRKRIELDPQEVREIPFTVKMNPEVKPGEYNVLISFADAPNRPKAEQKVMQGDAPGTIVHIAVDKEQNQFIRLKNFVIDKFFTKQEDKKISFTLENPGEVDVVPAGEIIIYNNKGQEVDSFPINTDAKVVPAGQKVHFTHPVPNLSMGKYKAFLSVEYGKHLTASVQDTAFFYVIPWKWLLLLFGIALFIAILIALYVHRRYDVVAEHDGSGSVAMYIKEGVSEKQHHDIDLSETKK